MKLLPLSESTDSEDSELEEFTDNNVNAPKTLYPDASIYAKDSILSIMHPCFHGNNCNNNYCKLYNCH